MTTFKNHQDNLKAELFTTDKPTIDLNHFLNFKKTFPDIPRNRILKCLSEENWRGLKDIIDNPETDVMDFQFHIKFGDISAPLIKKPEKITHLHEIYNQPAYENCDLLTYLVIKEQWDVLKKLISKSYASPLLEMGYENKHLSCLQYLLAFDLEKPFNFLWDKLAPGLREKQSRKWDDIFGAENRRNPAFLWQMYPSKIVNSILDHNFANNKVNDNLLLYVIQKEDYKAINGHVQYFKKITKNWTDVQVETGIQIKTFGNNLIASSSSLNFIKNFERLTNMIAFIQKEEPQLYDRMFDGKPWILEVMKEHSDGLPERFIDKITQWEDLNLEAKNYIENRPDVIGMKVKKIKHSNFSDFYFMERIGMDFSENGRVKEKQFLHSYLEYLEDQTWDQEVEDDFSGSNNPVATPQVTKFQKDMLKSFHYIAQKYPHLFVEEKNKIKPLDKIKELEILNHSDYAGLEQVILVELNKSKINPNVAAKKHML